MPLPTPTRLRQTMKGIPCEFSFNKLSLASVGACMKSRTGVQSYETPTLGGKKVREVVAFNKSTYKVDGAVDYGDGHDSDTTDKFGPHVCATVSLLSAADCKLRDKKGCPWKTASKACFGSHLGAIQAHCSCRCCNRLWCQYQQGHVVSKASLIHPNTRSTILVHLISSYTSFATFLTLQSAPGTIFCITSMPRYVN